MALEFLNVQAGGIDFNSGIFEVHPELSILKSTRNKDDKKKIIDKHFNNFYYKYKEYLEKRVKEFQREWDLVEKGFFNEAFQIFKNFSFKSHKYTGYLSIIDCNPRFLKNKSFQVFYMHPQGVRYVTSHEVLHFIFFDYALIKFPKLFKKLKTESGSFWDLSEIFNSVMHQQKSFIKIHDKVSNYFYPEHKKYLSKAEDYWQQYHDIDQWIEGMYNYLNK